MSSSGNWRSFVFGGFIPIVLFTVLEEKYGPLYGLVAAMVFGVGELIYEKVKFNQISNVTWISNGLILGLGLISIFTADGIWFKMQPAIMELAMAGLLWGTHFMKKPLLVELSKKQNPNLSEPIFEFLKGVNFRCGFFFLIHAGIATWAALHWTTEAWAILKGVGVTVSFVVYLALEILIFRWKMRKG